MGRTPDTRPGPLYEDDEILFGVNASPSAVPGSVSFDGTSFVMRDGTGPFNPRSGGAGITQSEHEALDTLVHDLAENSYVKVTRTSGQVTNVTVWASAAMLLKIREVAITRSGGQVSQVVVTQYDSGGVAVSNQTITYSVTRSGGLVDSVTGTES